MEGNNIVLIYGEPGVGKTEIVKGFVNEYASNKVNKPFCHYIIDNLCVFGDYHCDAAFLGTDKLSMSVQPLAVDFIKANPQLNFIIEGDRLFNSKFINALNPKVIILEADKTELQARRLKRGSNQDKQFLDGRITKINNVKEAHPYFTIKNNGIVPLPELRLLIKNILYSTEREGEIKPNLLF